MAQILVVDDDATILAVVKRMLVIKGHTAAVVGDGIEALKYLDVLIPDLILSDISMPRMDGQALFLEVRARGLEVPFVVMSGHLTEGESGRSGFDGWLPKPFLFEDLIAIIDATLVRQPV